MIETIEGEHSNNMDELLNYLIKKQEWRYKLWVANGGTKGKEEMSKQDLKMSEDYRRMYEAARFYRKLAE